MSTINPDMKITVAGLGGVGGFLGAALASVYPNVTFFARGNRMKSLRENGITLHSEFIGDRHAVPAFVTDQPSEIGITDILIISVKNYSLEEICRQLHPIVNDNTIIVPVLNGVDPADRTRNAFPSSIVVDSLIYIISASEADYSITQKGPYADLHIGTRSADPAVQEAVKTVHALFAPTGVNCIMAEDIEAAIWKKYIFNCAFNVMTAAYSATVGELRSNPSRVSDMESLLEEACQVALARKVNLPDGFKDERLNFFLNIQSPDGTSSMRRDVDAGRPTELESFSGYLLKEAPRYGLELPKTRYYYDLLKNMIPGSKGHAVHACMKKHDFGTRKT